MTVALTRLDPHIPDPIESRRRAAGRTVRAAYATIVFGILAFFVVYFGRPILYLGGPGSVSSPRYLVSLPYIVQINSITVVRGGSVKAGEEIGRVRSPQHDEIVATYMRSLADIAGRKAELRVKARVARESLDAARSHLQLAEEAVQLIATSSAASLNYRIDMSRERALANKAVVSQEAEAAEASTQLAALDEFSRQLSDRLEKVESSFADGRVFSPIAGIVANNPARAGQSLVAGTPIAEILDPTDVFVDWYVPNERLSDPKVGNEVFVLFGNRRILGEIVEILPVSDVYPGAGSSAARERTASQIARIQFSPGAHPPALNSAVDVHMHYTQLSARIASMLVKLFGLDEL
ncbi:HlyD family secretion protein [Bradyrhizobium canariense]|uniref:HlyD family secretion protein n=1 Tax=Bradyrhizobium canariense TaxID=255045 RepID=UPI000A199941|nr:HlyD family efflux transporter periplasmic adaptor subunit [Bradyrhizobium canariense]OSI23017.1 HlyD family secretion protein [Bradyrhizobium canariense]OSI30040.1 HlyD family secretion protein [Bradyrhizobium canariense]OSI38352.1 HlyD family secretion protein [Bradyrhizobium canariense]OSI46699.1 HlyD family secretion protein [Bradyrhizobium canariense]OSI58731.1 HlyD family secretion protein [Bradyrhizobium canariense]